MNETETRAIYIHPALKAAGWGVVEGSRIRREYQINKGRLIGHGQRSKPDATLQRSETRSSVSKPICMTKE